MEEPIKVLVVDDEAGILDFMQRILRFHGYTTLGAADGGEAIGMIDKESPAVALIDIQLHDSRIDGIGVLEHIKRVSPSTVCLMVTRITEPEAIARARALGAEQYLLKPLDTKELLLRLGEAVHLARQRGR